MLRQDHEIMISQKIDGGDHWTVLRLIDKHEEINADFETGNFSAYGTWKHTSTSYADRQITLTSVNPQYYYWRWEGGAHGGRLQIGSKMASASYREDQKDYFQVLITLDGVQRQASGTFKVASILGEGTGTLANSVGAPGGGWDFSKGACTWTSVRYER